MNKAQHETGPETLHLPRLSFGSVSMMAGKLNKHSKHGATWASNVPQNNGLKGSRACKRHSLGTWTSKRAQNNGPISQHREYRQYRVHYFGHFGGPGTLIGAPATKLRSQGSFDAECPLNLGARGIAARKLPRGDLTYITHMYLYTDIYIYIYDVEFTQYMYIAALLYTPFSLNSPPEALFDRDAHDPFMKPVRGGSRSAINWVKSQAAETSWAVRFPKSSASYAVPVLHMFRHASSEVEGFKH